MHKDSVSYAIGTFGVAQAVHFRVFLLLCSLTFHKVRSHDGHSFAIPKFCYDGKNEGHRLLNSMVSINRYALSKMDCVVQCVSERCCKSVNYRKSNSFDGKENCELLHGVASEQPAVDLQENQDYDYYIVLQPEKSLDCNCYTGLWNGKDSTLPNYETIGCFKDKHDRAIAPLEGTDPILEGKYQARQNALEKCYQAAKKRGFQMFAVQAGGWCASSPTAVMTFDKYGVSTNCKPDGEGGGLANQVYYIQDYVSVGCYNDAHPDRAIPTLEGHDTILDGPYQSRENAITKCAVAARRKSYSMFALQHGGQCFASVSAPMTFAKYGKSDACQSDGKGGALANEVYCIKK